MAVISIRPAQVALRNLGQTMTPNHMQHFVSPRNSVPDRSIVPSAVGDLARTIQQAGGQAVAAYLGYKQQENNIRLAEFIRCNTACVSAELKDRKAVIKLTDRSLCRI